MLFRDAQSVRGELIVLLEMQLEALQKECFGVATEADRKEYETRSARIRKLYELLEQEPHTAA